MINKSRSNNVCACYNGAGCSSFKGEIRCFCLPSFTGPRCQFTQLRSDEETIIMILILVLITILLVTAVNQICKVYPRSSCNTIIRTLNAKDISNQRNSIPSFLRRSKSNFGRNVNYSYKRTAQRENSISSSSNIYEEILLPSKSIRDVSNDDDYEIPHHNYNYTR